MKTLVLFTSLLILCGCGTIPTPQPKDTSEKSMSQKTLIAEIEKEAPRIERVALDVADEIEIGSKVKAIVKKQEARRVKNVMVKSPAPVKRADAATVNPEQKTHKYNSVSLLWGVIAVLSVALISSLMWRRKS